MFKLDSPLMTILNKVADILILNIIYLIMHLQMIQKILFLITVKLMSVLYHFM